MSAAEASNSRAALGLLLCAAAALGFRFAASPPAPAEGGTAALHAVPGGGLRWNASGADDGWVLDEAGRRAGPVGGWRGLLLGNPLDLNAAGPEDLAALPGVGEKTAGKILALRASRGGFGTPEDLLEIKGLGEKKLAALRPWVRAGR